MEEGRLTKKRAFDEIAKAMAVKGYSFSGEQCSTRMKTITRAYKNAKDGNSKSGNERKSYMYEEALDECFKGKPNITPRCVVTTGKSGADENTGKRGAEVNEDQDELHGKKVVKDLDSLRVQK